ncbi:MAG: BamA/TamA family outer membrane protein [Candidatus Eiseniibacteriota bacterium]|nr:MAG: BamA/TamA family outer membrane protein [Candidatus Eisenbacteria bacterium]
MSCPHTSGFSARLRLACVKFRTFIASRVFIPFAATLVLSAIWLAAPFPAYSIQSEEASSVAAIGSDTTDVPERTEAGEALSPGSDTLAAPERPQAREAPTVKRDTIYVPDLVEPENEWHYEGGISLGEGPDIEVRFGRSVRSFDLLDDGEGAEFSTGGSASYDRVDGFALFFHQEFSHSEKLYPRVQLFEGYGFGRENWQYRADFEQPLFSQESFSFGASLYLFTDTYDMEVMGTLENTLSSLFFKRDCRDYLEREGGSVFARQKVGGLHTATVEYAEETHRSLGSIAKGLFFRHSRDFRENPPVDEGKWAITTVAYEFDSRDEEGLSHAQYWHRVKFESGRNKDVADSDYDMLAADLRAYLTLSPGQRLRTRLQYGATPAGTLPFQKEFGVGGIGTLGAHSFKKYRGDHMLLLNVEYVINVVKRFQLIIFTDVGKAWFGRDALKDQRMELDVGLGIGREEGLRLCVARTPRDEAGGLSWILRLNHPF